MDSLEFLVILGVFAAILGWYLHNEGAKGGGHIGLFALRDGEANNTKDHGKPKRPLLQNRPGANRPALATKTSPKRVPAPKPKKRPHRAAENSPVDYGSKAGYRTRSGARYRVKKDNRPGKSSGKRAS